MEVTDDLAPQTGVLLHPSCNATFHTIKKCINKKITLPSAQKNQSVSAKSTKNRKSKRLLLPLEAETITDLPLDYIGVCRRLFRVYDTNKSGYITMKELKHLLNSFNLTVDEKKFRAWSHRIKCESEEMITFSDFVDACMSWFGESLVTMLKNCVQKSQQKQHISRSISAPSLHPYELMTRQQRILKDFKYHPDLHNDEDAYIPKKMAQSASDILYSAKHYRLREKQSANQSDQTKIYEKLHTETLENKVASNYKRDVDFERKDKVAHMRKKKKERSNQIKANIACANAFSTSIGMIGRHKRIGELLQRRECDLENKRFAFQQIKDDLHQHKEKMDLFNSRHKMNKIKESRDDKAYIQKRLSNTQTQLDNNLEDIRRNKQTFKLSSATSTLSYDSPELMAVSSIAETNGDRRRIFEIGKSVNLRAHDHQILEYKFDKLNKQHQAYLNSQIHSSKITVDTDSLPTSSDWNGSLNSSTVEDQFKNWVLQQSDLTVLVPPSNVPPLAMRYFSPTKANVVKPPFQSNAKRCI